MKNKLYALLKASNDINAVKKRKVMKRIKRRAMGKVFAKLMR